jgi:hypothetical protein
LLFAVCCLLSAVCRQPPGDCGRTRAQRHTRVRHTRRALTARLGGLGALSAVLGAIYLVVACESLPSFLGQVHGDTHPRTTLGAFVLGVALV